MAIKPPGAPGTGGITPPIATERTSTERAGASFASAVTAPPAATPGASTGPVEGAVDSVAADIRAGRLERNDAVDAVIERLVLAQLPEGGSSARAQERVSLTQLALGDNPGFTARVDRMLARALGEAG